MCVEKMTASQGEVFRLENVLQDLVNQRTQLQEAVTNLNEKTERLESDLNDALGREEKLKEEAESKILALEECVSGSESKVCWILFRKCWHHYFYFRVSNWLIKKRLYTFASWIIRR
jgi:TolA-binding protein